MLSYLVIQNVCTPFTFFHDLLHIYRRLSLCFLAGYQAGHAIFEIFPTILRKKE